MNKLKDGDRVLVSTGHNPSTLIKGTLVCKVDDVSDRWFIDVDEPDRGEVMGLSRVVQIEPNIAILK